MRLGLRTRVDFNGNKHASDRNLEHVTKANALQTVRSYELGCNDAEVTNSALMHRAKFAHKDHGQAKRVQRYNRNQGRKEARPIALLRRLQPHRNLTMQRCRH